MRLAWPLPAGDIGVEIASNDGSHEELRLQRVVVVRGSQGAAAP